MLAFDAFKSPDRVATSLTYKPSAFTLPLTYKLLKLAPEADNWPLILWPPRVMWSFVTRFESF